LEQALKARMMFVEDNGISVLHGPTAEKDEYSSMSSQGGGRHSGVPQLADGGARRSGDSDGALEHLRRGAAEDNVVGGLVIMVTQCAGDAIDDVCLVEVVVALDMVLHQQPYKELYPGGAQFFPMKQA
jgi:hypothetical protein